MSIKDQLPKKFAEQQELLEALFGALEESAAAINAQKAKINELCAKLDIAPLEDEDLDFNFIEEYDPEAEALQLEEEAAIAAAKEAEQRAENARAALAAKAKGEPAPEKQKQTSKVEQPAEAFKPARQSSKVEQTMKQTSKRIIVRQAR